MGKAEPGAMGFALPRCFFIPPRPFEAPRESDTHRTGRPLNPSYEKTDSSATRHPGLLTAGLRSPTSVFTACSLLLDLPSVVRRLSSVFPSSKALLKRSDPQTKCSSSAALLLPPSLRPPVPASLFYISVVPETTW